MKGHWGRRAGLSYHPLVPKRIHRRARAIIDQGTSTAIVPTLGCARLFSSPRWPVIVLQARAAHSFFVTVRFPFNLRLACGDQRAFL